MSYTFRGHPLSEKAKTGFLNLETGRVLTKTDRKGFYFIDVGRYREPPQPGGPYIAAPIQVLGEFLAENGLSQKMAPSSPGSLLPLQVQKPLSPRPVVGHHLQTPQPPSGPLFVATPPPTGIAKPFQAAPVGGVVFPYSQQIGSPQMPSGGGGFSMAAPPGGGQCPVDSAGSAIFVPKSTNVEDIPDAEIDGLCHFHLSDLKGRGKVTRVIDGDTIEMLIYVPLRGLAHKTGQGRGHKKMQTPIYTSAMDAGFFSLFSCRLLGVDFAEHNTHQGQVGTQLMTQLYATHHNYVYYETGKFDKYGRLLVSLYEDAQHQLPINTRFANINFPGVGVVAEAYFGGTKSSYMKDLPTINKTGAYPPGK